jgi:AcrR family transcriptional regulator
MNVRQKTERTRLSAEDWEDAALNLIAEQGVGALAVEALARQLGVTKGSFYWHFRTREALLQAALERWEQFGGAAKVGHDVGHRRLDRRRAQFTWSGRTAAALRQ